MRKRDFLYDGYDTDLMESMEVIESEKCMSGQNLAEIILSSAVGIACIILSGAVSATMMSAKNYNVKIGMENAYLELSKDDDEE